MPILVFTYTGVRVYGGRILTFPIEVASHSYNSAAVQPLIVQQCSLYKLAAFYIILPILLFAVLHTRDSTSQSSKFVRRRHRHSVRAQWSLIPELRTKGLA